MSFNNFYISGNAKPIRTVGNHLQKKILHNKEYFFLDNLVKENKTLNKKLQYVENEKTSIDSCHPNYNIKLMGLVYGCVQGPK